ncbi:glycosyltransferase family 2 protein [Bacteroides sp. 214]|uniref:glycosyltransferase family 2 protein n=1 Tax=Bacteroides sp. 214 TaxID=2302935 RepID=UPI0013CFCBC8|nr:glycosyltransferase family 2 protein [Bacteroides sp. 214]NDW11719.1 glycosyltransferase family 2 protein [Bacteroides sp. 214]
MHKVAIVILNWNGCEMLQRFLPSVLTASTGEGMAVYVADNGSTDNSVAMLQTEFRDVKLILLDKNYGFAQGYNLALQQVEAEYVVLLNSDVEVTEGWLAPLITYMDANPRVAACQPKIRSWHNKHHFEYAGASGGFIDKYGYPFCRGRIMNTLEVDHGQYDTIVSLFWATGAALFIRRECYFTVGGLDVYFFAHMEEIDLCWRLRARGYDIVCIPQSTVYHVGGATLNKENPHKTYLNFRNNLVMLYKNLPEEDLAFVMRIRCLLDYLAVFSFVLRGAFPNAKAVYNAREKFKEDKEKFQSIRQDNLAKTTMKTIPEQINSSILWAYYVRGKKFFSRLRF